MCNVVDPGDQHAAISLFEQRNGCVLNLERKDAVASIANDPLQRDLNHAAMRDHQDVAVLVPSKDLVDCGGDAGLEIHGALSAWHEVPVGLLDPARPCGRKFLGDLVGAHPLPVAQINLPERLVRLGLRPSRGRNGLGGLEGPLQVAGVKARESPTGESPAQAASLLAAFFRQRRVELALDAALAVPGGLPVANEQEARRPRPGLNWGSVVWLRREGIWKLNGDAGFRRLRARRSDLDIYTNFL